MENDYDYNKILSGNSFTDFYDEYIKILKRLKESGDSEYKIKHIKKYCRIIRSLEGVVRILFYRRESHITAITEMYKFLYEIIVKMICDIYEHIKIFQDDNFNEMEYYQNNDVYRLYDIEGWSDRYKVYTKLIHLYNKNGECS